MSQAPFPIDPHLTAIAIAYKNPAYIADLVLPRAPVAKKEFKYGVYPIDEGFSVPDSLVGRKSRPAQVSFTRKEATGACEDYALDDDIPQDDINQAPANYNPKGRSVEGIMNYLAIGREKRAADLVFNPSNYAAENKIALSGASRFSDPSSDPLGLLLDGLDACLMRPNKIVIGGEVWKKLRTHPKVVKAVNGNSGDSGIVSRAALAEEFEVQEVLVGQSRLNTAAKGKDVTLEQIWGNAIALIYIDPTADARGGLTFGFTAQFGAREASEIPNPHVGMRGGVTVRAGESLAEIIVASRAGYLITNAI